MSDNPYEAALDSAFKELDQLKEQERQLAVRKAHLQDTIDALFPLVFPDRLDINSLSLPNALRLIIRGAGRPMNANDFKTKLEDMGFDISKYDNPLANIHTAMSRMVESDEMKWVRDEGKKKAIPGPELKPVPQTEGPSVLPPPPSPVPHVLPPPPVPGKTLLEKVRGENERK